MKQTVLPAHAFAAVPDNSPSLQNPAVAHCCEVWEFTFRRALKEGSSLVFARVAAHKAFQKSMPPLTGDENIRNFVACVAQGMLMGSILTRDGARLIAAARVAKAAAPNRSAEPAPTIQPDPPVGPCGCAVPTS